MNYPGHPGPQGRQPQQPGLDHEGWQEHQQGWQVHPGEPAGPRQPGFGGGRWLVIGLVVLLLGGIAGAATWLMVALSSGGGSDTPSAAAEKLTTAIKDGDIIGLIDVLAPAEAALLANTTKQYLHEFKRLGVLDRSASLESVSGFEIIEESPLVFDSSQNIRINDRVTLTALTAGKLRSSVKFTELPLAREVKDAARPSEMQSNGQNITETVDIAEVVRQQGEPIRIATVKVDDEWYPSLFYTIAHHAIAAAGQHWPAERIPANGAATPNEAIKAMVRAAQHMNPTRIIELLPPGEMAVVHDLGKLFVQAAKSSGPLPFELVTLETEQEDLGNGITRSTLMELEIREPGGPGSLRLRKDGSCYDATLDGQQQRFCKDDIGREIQMLAGEELPPDAVEPLVEIAGNLFDRSVGLTTIEIDGKHYVSPFRTGNDIMLTILKSIDAEHIKRLNGLIPR